MKRAALAVCVMACGARTDLGDREVVGALPTPDLLWYKLDETSSDVAHDSSPNHKDMHVSNVAWSNGGVFHQACGVIDLDGTYRVAPITITAWLTPATRHDETANAYALAPFPPSALSGDVPSLGGFGLGLDVWTDGGGGAAIAVETGGGSAQTAFYSLDGAYAAGTRYFIALVVVGTTAIIYVDGAETTSVSADTPPPTSPVPLHLGCHNDDTAYGTKRFYEGTMRDVRVYRRVVQASEIAALYASGPV